MIKKRLLFTKLFLNVIIYILLSIILAYNINAYPVFSLILISSSGIILIINIWRLIYGDYNEIFNFGSLLLIFNIFFKFFNIFVLIIIQNPFELWPSGITSTYELSNSDKSLSVFIGELLSVFGTLIISLTWFFLGGLKFSNYYDILEVKKKKNFSIYFLLYFISALIYFINISELYLFNYISSYIIIYSTIRMNKLSSLNIKEHNLFRSFIMLLPFIIISIKSGMKEPIIVFLIPILIDFFYRFKTFYGKLLLGFGSFITFLTFSLIADFIRLNFWGTKQNVNISKILQELSVTITLLDFEFVLALVSKVLLRVSPLFYQGWTVSLKYINDIHYNGLFTNTFSMFVPRFLWPAKPLNNPEHEMTVIFYGDKIAESTNEASGLFSELYVKEGFLGFLFLTILLGIYLFIIQKIAFSIKNKIIFNIFNFILLFSTCRLHEMYFNAILPGFFLYLIIIIILVTVINLISKFINTNQ